VVGGLAMTSNPKTKAAHITVLCPEDHNEDGKDGWSYSAADPEAGIYEGWSHNATDECSVDIASWHTLYTERRGSVVTGAESTELRCECGEVAIAIQWFTETGGCAVTGVPD